MILTNRKAPVEWKSRGAEVSSVSESETITVKHCYVSICRVNKIMLSKYNNEQQ